MQLTELAGSMGDESTTRRELTTMLDHILRCVQNFERIHATVPDVVYINPFHYAALRRYHPELFDADEPFPLGFHLVIVPSSRLPHPEAALLTGPRLYGWVA
jgi:hypothetical protein